MMGVNLIDTDRMEYALTRVYGIGINLSKDILKATGVSSKTRVKELSEDEIRKIQGFIETNYKVEGDLKTVINDNIKRLREISSYRGFRHVHGLPVRGQRTKTNARTRKGKRRTIGALTKEAWAKIDQTQNKQPAK